MNALEDALIGRDPRVSAVGMAVLSLTMLAVLAQWVFGTFVFTGSRGAGVAWLYDGIAGIGIVLVGLSILGSLVYAGVNGGPALAVGLALGPTVFGSLLRGQVGVTVDLALALGAATCAAWIACVVSFRSQTPPERVSWAIGLSVAVSLIAAGVIRDISVVAGSYAIVGVRAAVVLFTIGIAIVVGWVLVNGWQRRYPEGGG